MKQNMAFAFGMIVVSLLLASMAAKAQSSMEVTCRAKAKEVALQAYDGCITEARSAKLIEIREGYKAEMSEVKSKYDRMLKDLKGIGAANKNAAAAPAAVPLAATTSTETTAAPVAAPKAAKAATVTARPGRAEKPVAGIARSLPQKMNDNGPALPIQTVSQDTPVVAAAPDASEIEASAANASGSDAQ